MIDKGKLAADGYASKLIQSIKDISQGKEYRIMEVCGSHTSAVSKYGLRNALKDYVGLISGPGCPVCVSSISHLDAFLRTVEERSLNVITFGDMLRVPGSDGKNLLLMKASGIEVTHVFSPLDGLNIAKENKDKDYIFLAPGFETTAVGIAATISTAYSAGLGNLSFYTLCKTMPNVLGALLSDQNLKIDGFLCPGHVSAITGLSIYEPIAKSGRAAVISGFESMDILTSIYEIVQQLNSGKFSVVNNYKEVVPDVGNVRAMGILREVFKECDTLWRGIGEIPASGLQMREKYSEYDAVLKYEIEEVASFDDSGCRCGDVLKGYINPPDCPLFGKSCSPATPLGACMVSSEGSCAAYYRYGG